MIKNIIVPVDFSKYAEFALKAASLLAKKHNAKIILIHMLELPQDYSQHDANYAQSLVFMIKYAERKMDEFIQKDFLEGIKFDVLIKHFKVFSELGQIAEERSADLIVMGSHGSTELEDLVLGSNTEKAIRYSDTPILVIKNDINHVEFENAIFVSDFKLESIASYKKTIKLFKTLNVKNTTLLFINKPDDGFVSTKEMNERFRIFLITADGNLENQKLFKNYDDYSVENGVYYYVKENNVSLIAIPTHGKSSVSKFFNKSISLDIANHAVLPVLTVKI